jgi:hypothetical protein
MMQLIKLMFVVNDINYEKSVKNLGNYIDDKLDWSHQVNFLCKKMYLS